MAGNEYVRGGDPGTSHRAVRRLAPKLSRRRAQCFDIVDRIGPCTRNDIRQQAQDDGHSPSVAETIRRRATDLVVRGILYVKDGTGDSEVLWFTDVPATVTPLHGSTQVQPDPPIPSRDTHPAGRRFVRRVVHVEHVPVSDVRRFTRGRRRGEGRQRPAGRDPGGSLR